MNLKICLCTKMIVVIVVKCRRVQKLKFAIEMKNMWTVVVISKRYFWFFVDRREATDE